MLWAYVVSVYNYAVPESLARCEMVFLETNIRGNSTGILEPLVNSSKNNPWASTLCNMVLVAMVGRRQFWPARIQHPWQNNISRHPHTMGKEHVVILHLLCQASARYADGIKPGLQIRQNRGQFSLYHWKKEEPWACYITAQILEFSFTKQTCLC